MKRYTPSRRVMGWVAVAAGAAALWWGYERTYAQPRRTIEAELRSATTVLERTQSDVNTLGQIGKQIRELAAGQLGQTEERVEANLRTALNEIAAAAGLAGVVVTTGDAQRVKNPAAQVASEWGGGRGRREQVDFRAMSASLKGVGTLAQALRVLAVVQHQAWAKRVDGFVINPVGDAKDRNRVDFTVRLTTVFLPDVATEAVTAENLWRSPPPEVVAAYGAVVAKNVFREPPAKPAVAQAPPPPPPVNPGPTAPAYGEWRVVALVRGAAGPELWLNNEKTQQRLTLIPGQVVLDVVFVGAEGEQARVKVGEQEFVVGLSQTLGDRQAVTRQQ